ncbi:DUF3343 domain-containing protein [Clostridium niameyense]|uniref:DUF3343 domain-containing protein n=1 Tax=Clostridium niameyense TaxID=1622073 RepID=A0A6M0RBI7_9CLOT|nr:DUF3343 domain-containing protein [Clostridium niameyense]NEZ47542.1 DUF3343 domain-containing protein [Clostridium niameyense]
MEEIKYYVLFPSHTEGMKLNNLLKRDNIKHTIVPTPRELSKSCGICIMYNKEDEKRIMEIVENNNVKNLGFQSLAKKVRKNYYI